jgi:hypothetical protein
LSVQFQVTTNVNDFLGELKVNKAKLYEAITQQHREATKDSAAAVIKRTPRRKNVITWHTNAPNPVTQIGWQGVLQASIAGPFAAELGVSWTGGNPLADSKTRVEAPALSGTESTWDGYVGTSLFYWQWVEYGNGGGIDIRPTKADNLVWADGSGLHRVKSVRSHGPVGMFANSLQDMQRILDARMLSAVRSAVEIYR